MSDWKKIDKRGAPDWLEVRQAERGEVYRIRYRRDGIQIEQVLKPKNALEFETWKDAAVAGEELIHKLKFGGKDLKKQMIRCEDLCREIIASKSGLSKATQEQTRIFFEKHIIPYLNEHCQYVVDLNPTVWIKYKTFKREQNPKVALFNHWKFFLMLFKWARQRHLIEGDYELTFNEKKEDRRAKGMVISDNELGSILAYADEDWKDRIIIQRLTGMRPGEVRCLRKDRVDFEDRVIRLQPEDTKTRQGREFRIPDEVLEILLRRKVASESSYFFPAKRGKDQPYDKNLDGWHEALRRARVNPKYTPHDLRHTYLTRMFKTTHVPALICFACGLTLEEAQETYLHYKAEDTQGVADESSKMAKELLKRGGNNVLNWENFGSAKK